MLDVHPPKAVLEDNGAILPDDAEFLERLKNAQLQSSVKSDRGHQAVGQHSSAEQHLDQLRHLQHQQQLLQRQIELQRMQQEQLERELKIQQLLYQRRVQQEQAQVQHPHSTPTKQQQLETSGVPLAPFAASSKHQANVARYAARNIFHPEEEANLDSQGNHQQSDHQNGTASGIPTRPTAPSGLGAAYTTNQQYRDVANEAFRFPHAQEARSPSRFFQNRTQNSQPVYKWPFEYAGQPNTILLGEFLNMVTTYAITEGVDETTLLRAIKHLLKGSALQWYTRCYMHLRDWSDFKLEIKREFLPPNYSEIVKQDLYLRFQEPNEPFANFYRDLVAAFEIVEPPLPESEKLFILKSHLNAEFTPIASAARVSTVKELVAVCRDFAVSRSYCMRNRNLAPPRPTWSRAENPTFNRPTRPSNTNQPFTRQQVNAMSRDLKEQIEEVHPAAILEQEEARQQLAIEWEEATTESEEVNAIRMQGTWPRNHEAPQEAQNFGTRSIRTASVTCWQCGNQGHTYPTCPNPKTYVFCYSCGNKGATTRNCQTCASRMTQLAAANQRSQPGNQ